MENFDVCVIGSSSAAYSSAITLAQKGIKTVLIKRHQEMAEKKYYGETLSQSIISSLFDIGMENSFQSIFMPAIENSISSWGNESIDKKSRLLHPSGLGWIFKRQEFEIALCERLKEEKAKLLASEIIAIEKKNDRWITNLNRTSISSDFIVIAIGRDKLNSFHLPRKTSVDKLICCIVSFKEPSNQFDRSIYVDSSKNGWFYSTMYDEDSRIVNYFTDGDLLFSKDEKHHTEFLKSEIKNLPALSDVVSISSLEKLHFYKVVSANTTFRTSFFHEGVLVCGDAAQTYDPLSSQGISNAIKNGINLGCAIASYYNGNKKSFKQYETGRRNDFMQYLKTRHQIYSNEIRWKNNPFWERRHNIEYIKSFLQKVQSN